MYHFNVKILCCAVRWKLSSAFFCNGNSSDSNMIDGPDKAIFIEPGRLAQLVRAWC
jgi:hypothetical protein